jgi:hypothetical protein
MRALLIPIGLVSVIGVAVSVACSASITLGLGSTFRGPGGIGLVTFGTTACGATYDNVCFDADSGFGCCVDGVWQYDTSEPSGYSTFGGGDDGGGTSDGAGGTSDGAGGTSDGAGGTSDGAGGTSDGAGGTSDGAGGTSDGAGGSGDSGGSGGDT